ncbi:hypothetical protein COLO4_03041 [Corchorus olitorius]|uniref:Uncharacterized protein n=1 Tax=Corchorus olitorius TaxID=93759 RepID=A0A1R3KZU5_9ROSI|nr:hypothetical protein COLO4_03041 [Corchorus olitorius]
MLLNRFQSKPTPEWGSGPYCPRMEYSQVVLCSTFKVGSNVLSLQGSSGIMSAAPLV